MQPDRTLADADPWPAGMVMAPQTADAMAIAPAWTADAADWPHGMVIGRRDSSLSALFAPLADALRDIAPRLL